MKYIKKFDSNTQYNTFKESEEYIKPNLSSCELETEVHFDNVDNPNDHILTFIAQRPNSTIALCCFRIDILENTIEEEVTSNNFSIEYSLNNSAWDNYDLNSVITLQNVGNNVKFRGLNDATTFLDENENYGEYLIFKMTGKIKAKGDVTSMLNEVGGNVDISDSEGTFVNLFSGCTALTKAPNLPSTSLSIYCYEKMFRGCTSLKSAPELPATALTERCYFEMFEGCTSLKTAPELPATTLADYCYQEMFKNCKSLTFDTIEIDGYIYSDFELPSEELSYGCYIRMFQGCKSLKHTPALSSTTLSQECYYGMFSGCTSLETPPYLPATELMECCYMSMFEGCTSLTFSGFTSTEYSGNTYELIAVTAATSCYKSMFANCSKLEATPNICLEELANGCCSRMFEGCSSLKQIVGMQAYTMAESCYQYMFKDCSSYELLAGGVGSDFEGSTTTAPYCFSHMFDGIKKLSNPSYFELRATTLSEGCYEYMFANTIMQPEGSPFYLPAQTLVTNCYGHMFENTTIHYIVAAFLTEPGPTYTQDWLKGVPSDGRFDGDTGATWYDDFDCGTSTIPCTWLTNMYDSGGGIIIK